MKQYILSPVTILALLIFLQPIPFVHAQGIKNGFNAVNQIQGNSGVRNFTSANDFIISILQVGLSVMGLIATAVIIYGGYLYVTAMGDEKKAEDGKHAIIYAVIGLIIIGGAAILTNVIISTFNKIP